jgi:DNA-binding MarR family transcriptional regulator
MSKNQIAQSPGVARGQTSVGDIELATSLRTVIGRLIKVLRKQTHNDELLSITERSTLALLEQYKGLLPTELAGMEKVTTQSMSQVINHLFELGYVHRTPSSEDKRKVLLSITASGKQYLEKVRQEKQEWLARTVREKISPKEKEILTEAMKILTKLMGE